MNRHRGTKVNHGGRTLDDFDRMQAARRPFEHRVTVRTTSFKLPPALSNGARPHVQEVYTLLSEDERRNHAIVEDVLAAVETGRNPIVLTERRRHVDVLAGLLSERLSKVFVLAGGMTKTQRTRLMEELSSVPADESRVIVATGRYLGEGFDHERLDTLFLTLPVSWRGTIAQYAGRLHRVHGGKKDVVIYDYVDPSVPLLAKMDERRRAGYKALGYEIATESSSRGQLALGDR